MAESTFPIPSSLQDLEREPYNLLPYPYNFDDDDEEARALSFCRLVKTLEMGNRRLATEGMSLFQSQNGYPDEEKWMCEDRVQALYTLVRKSTSLASETRWSLIRSLCQAVKGISILLDDHAEGNPSNEDMEVEGSQTEATPSSTVSQEFRDAFACHIYMLFSIMHVMESEAKIASTLKTSSKKRSDNQEAIEMAEMRAACAQAMLIAAQKMSENRNRLWRRGVPDESVVVLPCRIAYQMLESATGVIARKAASGDEAIAMIAATVDSCESLLGTIIAALMDMMHSYEHMAALCSELCTSVATNKLPIELIREMGRLDTHSQDTGKASGIKFVAPFINEMAQSRPRLVLVNISHIMPHLNSEPYYLRSAIVGAIGHIIDHVGKSLSAPGTTEDEDKDGAMSPTNLENSRGTLLTILQERAHDVSSYTRSAALKAWIRLVQEGSIPVDSFISVTMIAMDRLKDKTVIVRKQALQLLTVLLENNPFLGELDPEPYRLKLKEMYEYVKAHLPQHLNEAYQTKLQDSRENGETEEDILELESATLAAAIAEADIMEEETPANTEYKAKIEALKFAQSALDFIDQFENASSALHGMLLSANTSDVMEALRFFVKARHFKLPCAVTGMKQALTLMWSTEQNIKDEVLKAFIDVFIAVPGSDGKHVLPANQIAYNLIVLVEVANVSELASIEEAVGHLVKNGKIPADVFSTLWAAAANGKSCASAIQIIGMAANTDSSIVDSKSRLKTLLDVALGDETEERRDFGVVRAAAIALQRIERAQVDPTCAKYLVLERIMEQLCAVARGDWCVDLNEKDTMEWFSASEEAISALFIISPSPEICCADIIRGMHAQTLGSGSVEKCNPLRLARFFHVLGHIALKLLVYTEALSGTVRRANAQKSLKRQEEMDKAKQMKGAAEDDDIEAELGMAAELEAENERKVAEIAEKEIVGRGLLGIFGPILVRVVVNEGQRFNNGVLLQAATLSLCKFMCVSSSFCEKHLAVVFTALANAPPEDTVLRANTVIALGDLAFRFPNEVEPYTPRLYACLRDPATKVRRHTLMVLTHLILNDMVKVKGQVCEIALCLRDPDSRMRDTARLLFHELSKRSNNPVYNLLPDIISQLSQTSVAKEDFRSIMTFLLGYIKKERQNEMLIDKLCHRFPKCTTISQTADITYCMTQLKVNEKSVKCMIDNFKLYKDALHDEEIRKHFSAIITKAKKLSKPELKQGLEEWESKLDEQAQLGKENELAGEKAKLAKTRASKRKVTRRRKPVIESIPELSDHESDDNNAEEESETEMSFDGKENAPKNTQRSSTEEPLKTRRSRRRGANTSIESS
ncbi:unnamed protein product [Cylindrotheca closterium]|uniref:Condensin complex subunit 1 C-terminal domain-containing protein n=1 Tax=Cylindrotheca closterium TaxID=2856 RepID=A0AAD2CTM5_9STRA|nr:unnamed protein product [Cylindrotheca closterium]